MVRRLMSWLGGSLALLLLLTGCGSEDQEREHRVDGGPLSALTPGKHSFRSERGARIVTFGAITLCSADPDARIVLDAVRYRAVPAPAVVTPWLRTVPSVGGRTRGSTFDWRPLLVEAGYPPDHLSDGPWRGLFAKGVEGVQVDQTCFGASDLDARRIELLTALQVGPPGTAIKRIYVDYHVGADDYTLIVPGQQVVCGNQVTTGC